MKIAFVTVVVLMCSVAPQVASARVKHKHAKTQKIAKASAQAVGVSGNFGYLHLLNFRQFQVLYKPQKVAYLNELRNFIKNQEIKELKRSVAQNGGMTDEVRRLLAQLSLLDSASAQTTNVPGQNGAPPPAGGPPDADAGSLYTPEADPDSGASGASGANTPSGPGLVDDTSDCKFGKIGPNQVKREQTWGPKCFIGGNLVCLTPKDGEDKFRCTAINDDFKKLSKDAGCADGTFLCKPPLYMKPGGGSLCVAKGTGGSDTTSKHCDDQSAKPAEIVNFINADKTGKAQKDYNDMIKGLNEYCGKVKTDTSHFDFGDCAAFDTRVNGIMSPGVADAKLNKSPCHSKAKLYSGSIGRETEIELSLEVKHDEKANKDSYRIKAINVPGDWITTKCDSDFGKVASTNFHTETKGANVNFPVISGQPGELEDPRMTCLARTDVASHHIETLSFPNSYDPADPKRCAVEYQTFKIGSTDPEIDKKGQKICPNSPAGCNVGIGDKHAFVTSDGGKFRDMGAKCEDLQPMSKVTGLPKPAMSVYYFGDEPHGFNEIIFNPSLKEGEKDRCWGRDVTTLATTDCNIALNPGQPQGQPAPQQSGEEPSLPDAGGAGSR